MKGNTGGAPEYFTYSLQLMTVFAKLFSISSFLILYHPLMISMYPSRYISNKHTQQKNVCGYKDRKNLVKVLVLPIRNSSWIEFTCRRQSAPAMSTLRSAQTSSSCWARWVFHNERDQETFFYTDSIRHALIHTHKCCHVSKCVFLTIIV